MVDRANRGNRRGVLFFQTALIDPVLCSLGNHARKNQDRYTVRDSHKGIRNIGEVPNQVATTDAAPEYKEQEHHLIRTDALGTKQVRNGAITVLRPTEHGGIGEAQKANYQHQGPQHGNALKASRRQSSTTREDSNSSIDGKIVACQHGVVVDSCKVRIGEQRGYQH